LTDLNLAKNKLTAFDTEANNSLQILNLANNLLTTFSLGSNKSIKTLNIFNNLLSTFDICSNNSVTTLNLKQNKMNSINLKGNASIAWFSIRSNLLKDVQNLPPSVKDLFADREAVIRYDFSQLPMLKQLIIFKNFTCPEDLTNLNDQIKYKWIKWKA
jgi:hypothetical protein